MIPKLIVHGGAWNFSKETEKAHQDGVKRAVEIIYPLLLDGMSALDAAEKAVNILEEDPTYDAGRGAFLNEIGEIELDAMIMDGRDLSFGAVAAIQNFLHPVSIARKVMEKTEHCLLVGRGAQSFAQAEGFSVLAPAELLTERELVFFQKIQHDTSFRTHHPFDLNKPSDTVGAVVMDHHGNLAAATSTGGTARKKLGRVGDSPIVGAGAYADNQLGAVSTTGWGESIMKVLLAKTLCDLFPKNSSMKAAVKAIGVLEKRVSGLGGVIGINAAGDYAFAHNTPKMAFAYANGPKEIVAKTKFE
jgi:beta-aspartyl-peptidase (threonine type)